MLFGAVLSPTTQSLFAWPWPHAHAVHMHSLQLYSMPYRPGTCAATKQHHTKVERQHNAYNTAAPACCAVAPRARGHELTVVFAWWGQPVLYCM